MEREGVEEGLKGGREGDAEGDSIDVFTLDANVVDLVGCVNDARGDDGGDPTRGGMVRLGGEEAREGGREFLPTLTAGTACFGDIVVI